ncbi:hypothetical protein ACP70R_037524 [Stipagrostis hirtigluma subsp. patula]
MKMKAWILTTKHRAILVLVVLVLVGSCCAEHSPAGDEQSKRARGRRRRRRTAAAPVMVPITLLKSAVDEGAEGGGWCNNVRTCRFRKGTRHGSSGHMEKRIAFTGIMSSSPADNPEGGGWCNNVRTCRFRKGTRHGSSGHMEKRIAFTGIMSSSPADNPDFYNWNRVKFRYCDGSSFASDGFDKGNEFYFRGQRIWNATIRRLLSIGMASADQVLLTGCSAGGLAVILHCDEFSAFFPPAGGRSTIVNASPTPASSSTLDVSGGRSLRSYYADIVAMQGVARSLPPTCTDHLDPTSCFFPQNVIDGIKTPIFLLNSAYDVWQFNRSACTEPQMKFLQGFRDQMVAAVERILRLKGQRAVHPLVLRSLSVRAAGHLERRSSGIPCNSEQAEVKAIDCPYPCDTTCRYII